MIDWVAIWLTGKAAAFLFKPVLQELAKDATRDLFKDFCKDSLRSVFRLKKDEWTQAIGRAVAEFLDQFEQELVGSEQDVATCRDYTDALTQFIRDPRVRLAIGSTVHDPSAELDPVSLKETWAQLGLRQLPEDFYWRKLCRRYISKVRVIIRELPEIRETLDSINLQRLTDQLCGQSATPIDFFLGRYREAMRKRYGRLKLEELDPTSHDIRPLMLTRMFVPQMVRECMQFLPQAFELPKEVQHRLREQGGLEGIELDEDRLTEIRHAYGGQSLQPILEVVDDPALNRVVILGDPGSGKSMFLEYLVLRWAEDAEASKNGDMPPVLIELREYARLRNEDKAGGFTQFLSQAEYLGSQLDAKQIEDWLHDHRSVVLFDGLDEIFDAALCREVTTCIHRFATEHPNARIVVTSRVIGYQYHAWQDEGFRHFMLQELEQPQIEEFLERWHKSAYSGRTDGEEKQARLSRAIDTSDAIRQLAGNPLLLTMMAILNRTQDLPRDRGELYEQCARLLLHQWKVELAFSDYPELAKASLDFKDKRTLLLRVARAIQGQDGGMGELVNLIDESTLERTLADGLRGIPNLRPERAARALIEQLRARNFMLCFVGGGFYAFVHRTFLEYFCASDIHLSFSQDQTLTLKRLKADVFGGHWSDTTWHEVLCLLAGMLAPRFSSEIIHHLLQQEDATQNCQHVFLAACCVGEVRRHSELGGMVDRVKEHINALARFDLNYYYEPWDFEAIEQVRTVRVRSVEILARVWRGDPGACCWLKARAKNDEDESVRQAAVHEFARGWRNEAETLTWLKARAQNDEDRFVRQAAAQELARGWRNDPETLPLIKACAQRDRERLVRQTAVQELARSWRDDPETLPIVKSRIQNDEDRFVRRAAVRELVRGWKDNPETLPIIKACAQKDKDRLVRQAAIEELARKWKNDPETLPMIKSHAQNDGNRFVREAAVQQLTQGWKNDPETLLVIKAYARNDENRFVRRAALQQLAQGWKDNPEILCIIKAYAQNDEDEYVRQAAVHELAQGWKSDPKTLPWLKALAQSDGNRFVREAAVRELARGWKDDPGTLPIIKARVRNEEDEYVRQAAVHELARGFKCEPETLPLIKARASNDEGGSVRQAAIQELARGWKDDPETLPIIKGYAQNDKDRLVRQVAVQELTRGWKHDPETLPIIRARIQHDEDGSVRQTAVQELARGWKDDSKTLPWLKSRAQEDENRFVRRAAVRALAWGWRNEPETLPIIKACAQEDKDRLVRQIAMQELARGWNDDPEVLPIIKACAQNDENGTMRRVAIEELTRHWKNDPDMLPWLKTRAQNDDNRFVRQAAVEELARGWKDDPETLPIIKACAQNDENRFVRQAAVQELVRGWREDPEILPVIQACAQNDKNRSARRVIVHELARSWKNDPEILPWLKVLAQNDKDEPARRAAIQELTRGWRHDPGVQAWLAALQHDRGHMTR